MTDPTSFHPRSRKLERGGEEGPEQQERRSALIGFLTVELTEDKAGFIGALMILDERGYPLEFRCTTPIRPTIVQRALYGDRLQPYVSIELCGKRLLAEVQRKPAVVVASTLDLLALDRQQLPFMAAQKAGEAIEIGSAAKDVERERVESHSGRFQPVILITRKEREGAIDSAKEILRQLFQHCDLVEPFDRIRTALKFLAQEDPKYR